MDTATQLIKYLTERNEKIFFIESFTGGLAASQLIAVPGASKVVVGGIICYQEIVKEQLLQIDKTILTKYSAVSRECAEALLAGGKKLAKADYYVCFTGYAGNEKTENKDCYGFIGISYCVNNKEMIKIEKVQLTDSRNQNRQKSVELAYWLLVNIIKERL